MEIFLFILTLLGFIIGVLRLIFNSKDRNFKSYVITFAYLLFSINLGTLTFNYRKYMPPVFTDYIEGNAKMVYTVDYKNDTTFCLKWKGLQTGPRKQHKTL